MRSITWVQQITRCLIRGTSSMTDQLNKLPKWSEEAVLYVHVSNFVTCYCCKTSSVKLKNSLQLVRPDQ